MLDRPDVTLNESRRIPDTLVELTVVLVGGFHILLAIYRYVVFRLSDQMFVRDAQVWVRVGEAVLQGQALYADVADNKPPVWEAIAIMASATPWPFLALLLVVGLSSAALVMVVAAYAEQFVSEQAAVVTVLLLGVGLFEATNGAINNKTLALTCLLAGVIADRDVTSAVGYALAVLVAQQVVVAAPVVIWWEWRRDADFCTLAVVGLGLPVIAYAAVGIIWGLDALHSGIRQTILLAGDYAAGTSQFETNGSPLQDPGRYVSLLNSRLGQFLSIIAVAAIGTARVLSRVDESPPTAWLALGLTVTLALPLGIRLYRHYWVLPLVGASLLAAYGADWLLTKYADMPRQETH